MPDTAVVEETECSLGEVRATPRPTPTRKKVSMALINFWLDAALLLAIVVLGWVSAMMQIVFPPPTAADGWALWGLTYDDWRDVQFGSLCIFGLLVLEHLVLHWNWVCGMVATKLLHVKYRSDQGLEAVYGVGTLIGILTLMLAGVIAAILMVKAPAM
jgi:hypothetical protein